jgi:hypothetical protein
LGKVRIILGFLIPDIAGVAIISFPAAMLLSFTNFFGRSVPDLPVLVIVFILLISLSLFLFPFRLILVIVRLLKIELDKCGIFSIAIVGGLMGGGLFYFLIFSHFSLNWSGSLNYALLGVLQSLVAHTIYLFLPEQWKVQAAE